MKPLPPRWHPRGLQRKPPVYSLFGLVEIFNIFKEDLAPGPELTWLPVPPGKVSFSTSPSSSRLTRGEGPSPKEPGADPHQRGGSFPHRPRAPPGPDVPPIPPCRPLHLEHRPAPGTQGSPAGCRVHRMGPALQSPDQGTVSSLPRTAHFSLPAYCENSVEMGVAGLFNLLNCWDQGREDRESTRRRRTDSLRKD